MNSFLFAPKRKAMPLNEMNNSIEPMMFNQPAQYGVSSFSIDCAIRVLIFLVFPGLLAHFLLFIFDQSQSIDQSIDQSIENGPKN
jgi:hypothetical protein